jgi:hypothetical protein
MYVSVTNCYSHYMCFSEVLPPSPLFCRWWISGPSCYCMLPTTKYAPLPLTFLLLVLLLVHRIVAFGSLCWMCHGEVLDPLPYASGGTCLRSETKGKKNLNLYNFLFFSEQVFFPIYFLFFIIYIYILLTVHDDATKWFSECDYNHYYLCNKWKQGKVFFCKFNLCFKA